MALRRTTYQYASQDRYILLSWSGLCGHALGHLTAERVSGTRLAFTLKCTRGRKRIVDWTEFPTLAISRSGGDKGRMPNINLSILLESVSHARAVELRLRAMLDADRGDGPFSLDKAGYGPIFIGPMIGLIGEVQSLELPASTSALQALRKTLDAHIGGRMKPADRASAEAIANGFARLLDTLVDELKLCQTTVLQPQRLALTSGEHGFDKATLDRFPDSREDAVAAATSLNNGLWTACVMHAMRIAERGVQLLVDCSGAAGGDSWARKLDSVRTRLKNMSAGPEKQWLSEAAAYLDTVKDGFRNPAMHPEMSFDRRQAEQAFAGVANLMRLLASKLPS